MVSKGFGEFKEKHFHKGPSSKIQGRCYNASGNKKNVVCRKRLASFWGLRGKDYIFVPAKRAAGGLLIGWKSDFFNMKAVEYGSFSITAQLLAKNDGFVWWLNCIYGPSTREGKKDFGWN